MRRLMDNVLDIKNFPILSSTLIEAKVRQTIRLLCVFGNNGSKVIFATNDDKVYCFGHNRKGCLGLGKWDEDIRGPELNKTLTNKQLIDIAYGFEHCVALTNTGQCYSWGQNRYGQLGNGCYDASPTPLLMEMLISKNVVQISCGASHSLALTSDGEIWSWGSDTFGQLGDRHYMSSNQPTKVYIQEDVRTISCGRNHSMALTITGKVYVWGLNESGQLGRNKQYDIRKGRDKAVSNRPEMVPGLESIVFVKALCGPNHSMLLTSDGYIYSFGDNEFGQIGNGKTTGQQYTPFKLNNELKIKDIVTYYENDLSIAVSIDNKCFIWGFCSYKKYLTPFEMTDWSGNSLFDVYAKYAKNKITYKTIVVNDYIISPSEQNQRQTKQSIAQKTTVSNRELNGNQSLNSSLSPHTSHTSIGRKFPIQSSNHCEDPIQEADNKPTAEVLSGEAFLKSLRQSFNDPMKHDLKFIIGTDFVYCHKTILQIRNEKFWNLIKQRLNGQNLYEIRINPGSFTAFLAFLQFLYGIVPKINDEFIGDLLNMANAFDEPELSQLCAQQLKSLNNKTITLSNVCSLYEMAINSKLIDLENSCIEFAKNNWKAVFKSEEFEAMNEMLSKRLMRSIIG